MLGKRQIEDFTYFKTDYGKILETYERNSKDEIDRYADNVEYFYKYLSGQNIPMFYMTNVLPVSDIGSLPCGVVDYSRENAIELYNSISRRDIPIMNVREGENVQKIAKEDLFYKTDHHWSMKACFAAYKDCIQTINEQLGWNLDPQNEYTNLDNYSKWERKESFLGSYGVKVGRYYAGKDDFEIFFPDFQTKLDFQKYEKHQLVLEKTGTFQEATIDYKVLNDEDYENKYNAFSNGGYVENRIINRMADNNLKVLFISHSYGRPFFPYLSLCFRESRNLDPQEGRYNDSFKEYIDDFKPDIVLILTEFEGGYIPIPE